MGDGVWCSWIRRLGENGWTDGRGSCSPASGPGALMGHYLPMPVSAEPWLTAELGSDLGPQSLRPGSLLQALCCVPGLK